MQFLLNLQPEEIVLEPMDIDEYRKTATMTPKKDENWGQKRSSVGSTFSSIVLTK